MLQASFTRLLDTGSFSDFRLNVNGRIFNLHRAVLYERSQYFHEIFTRDPTIVIYDLNLPQDCYSTFDVVLRYTYSAATFPISCNSFCSLVRTATILKIPSLLDSLLSWMCSNIDAENVVSTFTGLKDLFPQLPTDFIDALKAKILKDYERIDINSLVILPYDVFLCCSKDPKNTSSRYRLSAALVEYLAQNRNLSEEQSSTLICFYLDLGWAASLPKLFHIIDPKFLDSLTSFAARNFSRLTCFELLQIPFQLLIGILEMEEIESFDEGYLMSRVQSIAQGSDSSNKLTNRKLWSSVASAEQKRKFIKKVPTKENLRCLIIGTVYYDVLEDVKKTISSVGLSENNIAIFNADNSIPSLDLLFKYDVVFAFTHYQFHSSSEICDILAQFVKNGGGLVYAYGFMRKDEWGCGDSSLLPLLPFTRAKQMEDEVFPQIIVKNCETSLMAGISEFKPGKFAPRSRVEVVDGSTLIASYSDGVPLVAFRSHDSYHSRVVGLNICPVTSRIHRYGMDPNQPMASLFGRSVLYSCGIEDW